MTKWSLSSEYKTGSTFKKSINVIRCNTNQLKKNQMIIQIDAEKTSDKFSEHLG